MSARPSFEDRLLDELKREIEVRGEDRPDAGARTVFTPRRIAVALAACAVAGLAAVVVPGSPAGSAAYAVEPHDDGSLTLTLNKRDIPRWELHTLADTLGEDDIDVAWGQPVAVSLCAGTDVLRIVGTDGRTSTASSWALPVKISLRPGDVLLLDTKEGPLTTVSRCSAD